MHGFAGDVAFLAAAFRVEARVVVGGEAFLDVGAAFAGFLGLVVERAGVAENLVALADSAFGEAGEDAICNDILPLGDVLWGHAPGSS